jgi:prevent-host-death family protein
MRATPPKTIPHRELRNHSGEILRQAESGQRFTITVEGRPVAVIGPYERRQWVPRAELVKILQGGQPDPAFLEDVRELGGTLEDFAEEWER